MVRGYRQSRAPYQLTSAMAKDRTLNPAAAHLKSEKAKAHAKAQKQRLQQRQEKLARRNPDRIQRQIDELRGKDDKGLALSAHEKKTLEDLERDLKGVKRAREALGLPLEQEKRGHDADRGGFRGRGRGRGGGGGGGHERRLAYGRRDGTGDDDGDDSDASTASSVATISLPAGPPPLLQLQIGRKETGQLAAHLTGLPAKPSESSASASQQPGAAQPVVTTYSSAPVMRDLKKEAAVFTPAAVHRQKKVQAAIDKIKRDAEDLSIDDEQ
ncbi:hypothetical protein Dda_4280 [Drechslerella dactyloides]|uniref:Wbp11/ELF5/Saf1 N-terminal domain-containing protein n=1 Tax=Drechslerella dactyloides TaxID=74499 RepID=A0AAD6NKQ6_DREDA|nr:hypothetical protein Dda_4280 [Drechslerella dactyloides]